MYCNKVIAGVIAIVVVCRTTSDVMDYSI